MEASDYTLIVKDKQSWNNKGILEKNKHWGKEKENRSKNN